MLPANFRKLPLAERRIILEETFLEKDSLDGLDNIDVLFDAMESMIENAAGAFAVPMGFIPVLQVNGKKYTIPMATEEPSVIAAAGYAAVIINRNGGVTASGSPSLMTEQVYLRNCNTDTISILETLRGSLKSMASEVLASMERRGGGLRDVRFSDLNDGIVRIDLITDVRNAMGANILNTLGEYVAPFLAERTGSEVIMAILSNSGEYRISKASISIPDTVLFRAGKTGAEIAEKIALASSIAHKDPERAVTHNKGIMNGIHELALATGNDTRALESAVHYHASISGAYKPLSQFNYNDGFLNGIIDLPVSAAIIGGAVGYHPAAKSSLKILGVRDMVEFSEVAAAVGLVQNFAALFALVSEGIQKGHMRLHARKTEIN